MLRRTRGDRAHHHRSPYLPVSIAAEPGTLDASGLRRVVVVLSITEITSWGILYYAFAVLSSSIVRDTGWSQVSVTAAFSASLVVSGIVGIVLGRRLDRFGPRRIMTTGSVLAVIAVLVIAASQNYAMFVAGWLIAGAAAAGFPPRTFHGRDTSKGGCTVMYAVMASCTAPGSGTLRTFLPFGSPKTWAFPLNSFTCRRT